jgi:hypothetical protein
VKTFPRKAPAERAADARTSPDSENDRCVCHLATIPSAGNPAKRAASNAPCCAVGEDVDCRLILVEGVPGSGKTTTSKWICEQLEGRGVPARWCDELDPSHPVIDRATVQHCREPGYAQRCVGRWSRFVDSVAESDTPSVWIVEACLFQNTVRFLLEHEHSNGAAERYADETGAALTKLSPQIVYLTQPGTREFLERSFVARKGEDIVTKIATYTETTACARSRKWQGLHGTIAFYAHYRSVCDRLLPRLRMPVLELDSSDGNLAASRRTLRAWLDRLADNSEVSPG